MTKRIIAAILSCPIWLVAGLFIIPICLIMAIVGLFVALVEYAFTGEWDPW